jgi:hypothetical protein
MIINFFFIFLTFYLYYRSRRYMSKGWARDHACSIRISNSHSLSMMCVVHVEISLASELSLRAIKLLLGDDNNEPVKNTSLFKA